MPGFEADCLAVLADEASGVGYAQGGLPGSLEVHSRVNERGRRRWAWVD